ncbi:MAG TPA: ThiF family adenylyltransferase, partial [Xanthobacteraceae bacterium]|nr:ThiF family adenylyltransferase [Xanthobacteraceae bacterium]
MQNEGYDLEIRGGFLLVRSVPYVDAQRNIKRGTLISPLKLTADKTDNPIEDHVAHWIGDHPCHANGTKITAIENGSAPQHLGHDIKTSFTFSAKAAYRDYHHKMTTYIGRITGEATVIDPMVTARIYPPIPADEPDSIFKYIDTASSRSGIDAVNQKLAGLRIAIIGLGGTGAYVLDLVAKTWVKEIHLFDGDVFSQHNAFRAPGALSLDELAGRPSKVHYYEQIYGKMRNGIVAREEYITEANLDVLNTFDFVFICMDRGEAKRPIVEHLASRNIKFVDVGMGVVLAEGSLAGIVRLTTST